MNDNETYSDFITAVKEAYAKLAEELEKVQEALCDTAENIAEEFKKLFEEEKYIYDREPLPTPPKDIQIKIFTLDRRTAINKIKKKKGTVY